MSDIFDEVSEDLRADRAKRLIKRYGVFMAMGCVLVIAGIGGWEWYDSQRTMENQRVASLFAAAATKAASITTDSSRADAIAAFHNVEQQGHPAYAALARLNEAALQFDAKNQAAALALWDQVAQDASLNAQIRDLATLLWVQHQADQADPAVLSGRLQPLLATSNGWHSLAAEQMALVELRQGKTNAARTRLQQIESDSTASQNVRGRAAALLASLNG